MSIFFLFIFSAAILGAILGSFLNALSFRFNTGKKIFVLSGAGAHSRCMHCGHQLSALDLVPLFSFLFLRARCRYCGSKISWQYPLVEMVAAGLSVLVFLEATPPQGGVASVLTYAFWLVVWMVLLFIVVYDIKHKIIPWSCSILLGVLALASLFVPSLVLPSVWQLLAGPLLALPLFLISLVSGGRWMGWADSALELSLGWLLGLSAGATAFMLAFWSGAAVGILMLLYQQLRRNKKPSVTITMQSEIPFAPFLILGAALAFFFHVDFFSTFSSLF